MPAFDLAVLVHYERPWPYEAHLAEQDVEELRELIQRRSAEELSDLGDPGIGGDLEQPVRLIQRMEGLLPRVGVLDHRAELEHLEVLAVPPDARLTEQDRAGRVKLDRRGDDGEQGRGHNRPQRSCDDVEGPLEQPGGPGQAKTADAK